jgi:hypothetical protein
MKEIADDLRRAVDTSLEGLRGMSEADATRGRGNGKWVKKEILGHLIDSASNNHQRFVRGQLADSYAGPGYQQEAWVATNGYRGRPWPELVELWSGLNRHLAHVIETAHDASLATPCRVGDNAPVTLEELMRDYVRHLRHHLAQVLGD